MRTILAIILGIFALLALITAVGVLVSQLRGNSEEPFGEAVKSSVFFGVIFVVLAFLALLVVPVEDAEEASEATPSQPVETTEVTEEPSPEPTVGREARSVEPETTAEEVAADVIPGLGVSDVLQVAKNLRLTCGDPDPWFPGEPERGTQWLCLGEKGEVQYDVFVLAPAESREVRAVEASVTDNAGADNNALAAEFLSEIAAIPYEGSEPERAAEWVTDNISAEYEEASFGGVSFALNGSGDTVNEPIITYSLDIPPAGQE